MQGRSLSHLALVGLIATAYPACDAQAAIQGSARPGAAAFTPCPNPARSSVERIDEHLVYFGVGSASFHCAWHAVVLESAAREIGSGSAVEIIAHADSQGSAASNLQLSEKRGRAVADALIALGVRRERISIRAVGESRPAVSAGDDVSEPLNRFAVITWRD